MVSILLLDAITGRVFVKMCDDLKSVKSCVIYYVTYQQQTNYIYIYITIVRFSVVLRIKLLTFLLAGILNFVYRFSTVHSRLNKQKYI